MEKGIVTLVTLVTLEKGIVTTAAKIEKKSSKWKIGARVKIDPAVVHFVVWTDRGWKMLNWWIVIPVLAPLPHIPNPPKFSMKIKLYSVGPSFCCQRQRNYEISSRSNAFEKSWPVFVRCQSSYYSILKKRILYSWMPPPPSLPARGRSKGEWTKIALFLGRARVSKLCTRGKSYNLFDQERQKIFATTSVGRHWSESGDMSGPVCSCTSQPALRRFYPRQISAQKLSVVCTAFLCICLFFTFLFLLHDEIFLPFKYLYKVAE